MRAYWVLVVVGSIGCLSSNEVCSNGDLCPDFQVCDGVHGGCVAPDQLTSCGGKANNEPCDIGGQPTGVCDDGVCLRARCGDGIVNFNEQCDGDPDEACTDHSYYRGGMARCGADCVWDLSECAGTCGDKTKDDEEACDDLDLASTTCKELGYYNDAGLKCSRACTFDVTDCTGRCGDHILDPQETCDGAPPTNGVCLDFGFDAGALTCSALCSPNTAGCRTIGWTTRSDIFGEFASIWGFSSTDVFLAGNTSLVGGADVAHWNGTGFTTEFSGISKGVRALWGVDADHLFAAGLSLSQRSAGVWSPIAGVTGLLAIHGTGMTDITAVGSAGKIVHFDGTNWTPEISGTNAELTGVITFATRRFAVSRGGTILSSQAIGSWTPMAAPTSTSLSTIWGATASDVWAGGVAGTLLHFDGTAWSVVPVLFEDTIIALSGTGPNDVDAVGSAGLMLHFDGSSWLAVDSGTTEALQAVWRSPTGDGFAAYKSVYMASESVRLTETSRGAFRALGGRSSTDIFAAGDDGIVTHFDGAKWSVTPTNRREPFTAISGHVAVGPTFAAWFRSGRWNYQAMPYALTDVYEIAEGDAWAVGPGKMLHFDGTTWTEKTSPSPNQFVAIAGFNDTMYAIANNPLASPVSQLYVYNGTQWIAATAPPGVTTALRDVAVESSGEVWVCGDNNVVMHKPGATWTADPPGGAVRDFVAITITVSSSSRRALLTSGGSILIHDSAWRPVPKSPTHAVFSIASFGSSLFAAEASFTVESTDDDAAWVRRVGQVATDDALVFAPASNEVIVASSQTYRFDGTLWGRELIDNVSNEPAITGIAGAHDDLFVANDNGIYHYNGATWTKQVACPAGTPCAQALFGAGDDVWAVGPGNVIQHYNGVAWSNVATIGANLSAVWASGPSDVFVASDTTIGHYDGTAWSVQTTLPKPALALWGSGPLDVFATAGGAIYHYDGVAWSAMMIGTACKLVTITGTARDDVFAGCETGSIFHYDGAQWAPVRSPIAPLRSIAIGGRVLYATGDSSGVVREIFRGLPW